MLKKVLILGSKGTLGQTLVQEFKDSGYDVTPWDKENLDLTGELSIEKFNGLKPDVIINATAYNATDPMQVDVEAKNIGFILNSDVPCKLAKIANELNSIFVHYSTDYVFDGKKKEGYEEDDKPNPISIYGQSKFEGEKNVQKFGQKFYIIRLSRLFGEKGASEVSKRSFVEIMLGEIEKPELMVKDEEISSPTYAPDLAKFTRELIESGSSWGIYHGANSGSCTWYGWAEEIFRLEKHGPKMIKGHAKDYHNPAPHPEFSILLNTKRPAQRSWQDALKEFLTSK